MKRCTEWYDADRLSILWRRACPERPSLVDPMTLVVAHGVEGAPTCLWRLLRIELKSRDTSFFHAAPLLLRI
jgi:hypothetical protein